MVPGVALCQGGNVEITPSAWEDKEFRKIVSVVLVSVDDDGGRRKVSSAAGERFDVSLLGVLIPF
jgi:hypothetical protein